MNYPAEKLEQIPWIVSEGTLRTDHLAAAYLAAIDALELECPEPFRSDLQQAAAYASDVIGPDPVPFDWHVALDWAAGALNDAAPTGFYFGASEGDEACIGFWLEQDWVDALEERGLDRELEDPADAARFVQAATEYGLEPGSLCDGYCGSASGLTASEAGAEFACQMADDLSPSFELDRTGSIPWPFRHIDWEEAWRELELSDGYAATPSLRSGTWWIFRPV